MKKRKIVSRGNWKMIAVSAYRFSVRTSAMKRHNGDVANYIQYSTIF